MRFVHKSKMLFEGFKILSLWENTYSENRTNTD